MVPHYNFDLRFPNGPRRVLSYGVALSGVDFRMITLTFRMIILTAF